MSPQNYLELNRQSAMSSTFYFLHDIRRTLLSLVLVFMPLSLSAQTEWTHLEEPFSGNVYKIVEIDGGVIVGSEQRGIQFSDDDGMTWRTYGENQIPVIPIGAIDGGVSGGVVIGIFGEEGGIVRITSNGDSLRLAARGVEGKVLWGSVAPNDSIYVLTNDAMYRSGNGGMTWTRLSQVFDGDEDIVSISFDGDRVLVVYTGKTWYSEDMGETFVELTETLGLGALSSAFNRAGEMMIGTTGGIYRSVDSGASFEFFALASELPLFLGTIIETPSGEYVVPTIGANLYRISADGTTESRLTIPARLMFSSILMESGTILIADFGSGVWRSTDEGTRFAHTGLPFASVPLKLWRSSGGDLLSLQPTNVASSSDGGETWNYRFAALAGASDSPYESLVSLLPLANGEVLGFGFEGSVVRWTPDGKREQNEDQLRTPIITTLQSASGTILAGNIATTFRSTDNGENWSNVTRGVATMAEAGDRSIWSVNGDLAVSRDDGMSFTPISTPLDSVTGIYDGPEGSLYLAGIEGGRFAHRVSTDNGGVWDEVILPCQGALVYRVVEMGGSHGLGLISDCGVHLWNHSTSRWTSRHVPLPSDEFGFQSLLLTDDHLFAGGAGGIYRTANNFASLSVPIVSRLPDVDLAVSTSDRRLDLQITLNEENNLHLELFSLSGERIATVENWSVVPGENRTSLKVVEWIPSGLYILRVRFDDGRLLGETIPIRN